MDSTGKPIYSTARQSVWTSWLAAVLWNALTWPAIIAGHERLPAMVEAQPYFWVFSLFPLLGVFVLFSAIRETRMWLKFGRMHLVLDGSCRSVAGYILLPEPIGKAAPAKINLICFRDYVVPSADGDENRHEALWQDEATLTPKPSGGSFRLDFRFHPPGHLPGSGKQSKDSFRWELRMHMPLPGIDCRTSFPLPVSPAMLGGVETMPTSHAVASEIRSNSMPSIENTANGLLFLFPAGRAKGAAIAFLLIGLFFGGFGFFMFQGMQHFLVITSFLIFGILLAFAVALILLGVYLAANRLIVEAGPEGVRKSIEFLGFRYTEQVAAANIVDIQAQSGGSTSYGQQTHVYYSLKLIRRNHPKLEVGDSIENFSAAQLLREKMLAAIGIQPTTEAEIAVQAEPAKQPLPDWLKKMSWLGMALKYGMILALLYDLTQWWSGH